MNTQQAALQALARRAARHEGDARQRLDARLARWQAALDAAPAAAGAAHPPAPGPGPLAGLLAHLAAAPDGQESGVAAGPAPAVAANGPRLLKAVQQHRGTWSRLVLEQRLHQALATVPDKAGPLNTQRLVHQALAVLRDTSPDYLHHFMTQVEALLWLDQASMPPAPAAPRAPARAPRARP